MWVQKGESASGAKQLSMGFGFVEYSSSAAAREALRLMKNVVLDGHTLEVGTICIRATIKIPSETCPTLL